MAGSRVSQRRQQWRLQRQQRRPLRQRSTVPRIFALAKVAHLGDSIPKVLTDLETRMLERMKRLNSAHEELRQNMGAHQAFPAALQSAKPREEQTLVNMLKALECEVSNGFDKLQAPKLDHATKIDRPIQWEQGRRRLERQSRAAHDISCARTRCPVPVG